MSLFSGMSASCSKRLHSPCIEQLLVEETVGQQGTEAVLNRRSRPP